MSAYNGPRPGWERARQLPPELIRDGACTDPEVNPDWFLPEAKPAEQRRAQRVCGGCPVRAACLEWALERGEWGTWGGQVHRHDTGVVDPEVREMARQLLAEGKDHRQVADLLDVSIQTAIGYQSAWRRDQRRSA